MKSILLLAFSLALLPVSAREADKTSPVDKLIKIIKFEQTVIDSGETEFAMVEQSLAGQDLNKKEMAEVKDAFMAYMGKVASDSQLKAKTKAAYEKAFTDDEINALIAFYKTPVGQKTLNVMPAITGDIIAYSQHLAQKHVGAFQDAFTKILENRAARGDKDGE